MDLIIGLEHQTYTRKKNSLINKLSRQLPNKERPNKLEKDIKKFINYKLNVLKYTATLIKIKTD